MKSKKYDQVPCNICCCKPTACNCCRICNDAGEMASVAIIGLCCCGGFGNSGVEQDVAVCDIGIFMLAAARLHKFACICCIFFCSFSFCVSANFTTSGAEQPSIVCDWCKVCCWSKRKRIQWSMWENKIIIQKYLYSCNGRLLGSKRNEGTTLTLGILIS